MGNHIHDFYQHMFFCVVIVQFIFKVMICTHTLQMFAGNYRDSTGKLECRDFKFMGIACIPAIPVILKSPHSDFHCNICRKFDIAGILQGFPASDVGKPCKNFNFLR